MPWYPRVQCAISALLLSVLLPTQATNLALVVSALLAKRTFCLSDLARAYPRLAPEARRVPAPKHDLLHRLKRLSRFLGNPRVDALAIQVALIPTTIAALGRPRILGLAIDWTYFESTLPTGAHIRYQVLRIAVPRRGRAVPLLHLAYDWDDLPAGQSQNQLEEAALLAVVRALPPRVHPVILADRGFARATFLEWLQAQQLDYVVRIDKGTCITELDGRRWKLGEEGLCQGDLRFHPLVRYGLYHGRPRELWTHLALTWRLPRHQHRASHQAQPQQPEQPWYLATNLPTAAQAVAWYRQRFWIEESFRDAKSRFRLKHAQIGSPARLTRLLMALTIALCWLALFALPELHALPDGFATVRDWSAAACTWGRPSFLSLALVALDLLRDLPLPWLTPNVR
jgi:Transposase DDE domain